MPYKSDAQRRFFHAAEARGDIKPSTVQEFDSASKGLKLPEHVKPLVRELAKRKAKRGGSAPK